jgi:hypothetical protein
MSDLSLIYMCCAAISGFCVGYFIIGPLFTKL